MASSLHDDPTQSQQPAEFPWVIPLVGGLSVWLLTPALVLVRGPLSAERMLLWSSVVIVMLGNLTHPTPGFTQLGYRYLIDVMPLLLCLMRGPSRLAWILLGLSIAANAWGVLVLNILGIYTYY